MRSIKSIKWEFIFLFLIFILTLVVRFLKINEIPTNITGDEVNFLVESLRITLDRGKGFFALCEPGQQPCFNDYLTALPLKVLGYHHAVLAIRLPNLLMTSIMIFPFYSILRLRFSAVASLLATLLFTTSYWNLNFSRSAWNPAQLNFYFLMFIFLLDKWFSTKKFSYLISSGFFSGLMFYGYHAGKYFLIIFFIYTSLSIGAAWKNQQTTTIKKHLLTFVTVAFVTILLALPQLLFIYKNKSLFLLRPTVVSIFSIKDYLAYHQSKNFADVIKYQFANSLRGIIFLDKVSNNDIENLRYLPDGSPLVDLATRALVLLGIFLIITKFRTLNLTLWIISFYAVNVFLISIPTTEPLNSNRIIMLMPILYFLVALGLDYVIKIKKLKLLVIIISVIVAFYNLNAYFGWAKSQNLSLVRHPALEYEDLATWIELQIPVIYRSSTEVVRIEHEYLIKQY